MNINQAPGQDKLGGLSKAPTGQTGKLDGVSAQATRAAEAYRSTNGEDVQLLLRDSISGLLDKIATQVARRSTIVDSLPDFVKDAVKDILKQLPETGAGLEKGLTTMLGAGKRANSELRQFAALLETFEAGSVDLPDTVPLTGKDIKLLKQLEPAKVMELSQQIKELAAALQKNSYAVSMQVQQLQTTAGLLPGFLKDAVKAILAQLPETNAELEKGLATTLNASKQTTGELRQFAALLETFQAGSVDLPESVVLIGKDINLLKQLEPAKVMELSQQIKELAAALQKSPSVNGMQVQQLQTMAESLPGFLKDAVKAILEQLPETGARSEQGLAATLNASKKATGELRQLAVLLETFTARSAGLPESVSLAGKDINLLKQLEPAKVTELNQQIKELAAVLQKNSNAVGMQVQQLQAMTTLLPDPLKKMINVILQQGQETGQSIKQKAADGKVSSKTLAGKLEQLSDFLDNIHGSQPAKSNSIKLSDRDMNLLRQLEPEQLNILKHQIKELAATMQSISIDAVETEQNANKENKTTVIALALPLYLGDEAKAYPAYIHIYHYKDEGAGTEGEGKIPQDTWLRVCLDTEYLGIVDLVFHLQQDVNSSMHLGIRAVFSDSTATAEFAEYVPEIRQKLTDSSLAVSDITVRTGAGIL